MHKQLKILSLICYLLLLLCNGLYAQEEEFNISIADKTEETGLLQHGQWQGEAGFLYNGFRTASASGIGQLFVRYGLSDGIEIRLLTEDGRERDRYMEETVQSTYPLAAGSKIKVLEEHAWLPDMTLVAYLHLPFTAHNKSQKNHWSPMIFMAFQHQLSDKWSLDYNAGAQQEAFGTSYAAVVNGSVHYKITFPLEVFTEYFAQYEPNEPPQHNIGGGCTYAVSSHFAVYIGCGHTVFEPESNYFITSGVAFKY